MRLPLSTVGFLSLVALLTAGCTVLALLSLLWAVPVAVFGGIAYAVYQSTPRRGGFQDSMGG